MSDTPPKDDAIRIRDLPHEEFMKLMRKIGPDIKLLSLRGDKFAQAVMRRYQDAFEHPGDMLKDQECRIAVEDYMRRDLHIAERAELGSRFGHYVDEQQGPTRIVVPNTFKGKPS